MKTKLSLIIYLLVVFSIQNLFSQIDQSEGDYIEEIANLRNAKDLRMADVASSPFTADQITKFKGLNYFPVDVKYRIEAQFAGEESPKEVRLKTTSGNKIKLLKYGQVTFEFEGNSYTLTVFQNKDLPEFGSDNTILFIPFKDLTAGEETYESGRYLSISAPGDDNKVVLDFNMAINPYSAYNDQYFGVVPPDENSMGSAMGSGERKYEDR